MLHDYCYPYVRVVLARKRLICVVLRTKSRVCQKILHKFVHKFLDTTNFFLLKGIEIGKMLRRTSDSLISLR